ncbi:MAG: phage terminase large subunit family protein [Hyphomonadaceae bacterium]
MTAVAEALPTPKAASGQISRSSLLGGVRARALACFAPPQKIRLAEWIPANIVLPAEVSATPGPMEPTKVQEGILDAIDSGVQRVTWQKCARIGATSLQTAIIGAFVKNDPSPILCLQPTLDDTRDYFIGGIDATLGASPSLRGLITRNEGKRDTIVSRRFPSGWLKGVAAQSPRNLRRHTVRILIMDEVDAYTPSSEGSATALAEKRTLTFSNRLIFSAGTPTLAETSNIAKAYDESDKRIFEFCCPDCAEWFEPRWEHVHWDKAEDGAHLPDTAHMVCPSCGVIIEETKKAALIAGGRWRATAPNVKGHAGFKCSALVSTLPNATWADITREFLAAKNDPELLKVWTNTLMGDVWADRAGDGLDEHILAQRAEPIGLGAIPEAVRLLTMGVDLQENRLEIVTLGHSETQTFALAYETIHGPPTSPEVWQDLDDLLKRRFAHPLGGTLGYDAAAIDSGSGSHTDIVYKYTRPRFSRRVVAIKGDDGSRPIIERSSKQGLYLVGTDGAKSRVFGLLERPGPIRFSVDLPARFYEELCSERRVTYYKAGQPRTRWERITGQRNEALDAFIYALAVRHLLNQDLTRRENVLREIAQKPAMKAVYHSKWMSGHDR